MEEYKLSCVMSYSIRVSKKDAERIKEDPVAYMQHAIETGMAVIEGEAELSLLNKGVELQEGSDTQQ